QTEIEASRGRGLGRQEAASRSNQKKHRKLHPEEIARQMRRFDHEPSVDKAQRAAVRLALAGHQLPARLLRAAPRAAWLPKVQLGAGAQQRRDRRLEEEVGSPSFLRADAANQITYEIKLSWDLPRLIFEPNTLKVVREAQRITELREQVVMQVTRLYFERRRLQIEILARPSASAATALGRELRLAELTAILNALTGGLFGSRRGQGSVGR
ncbi:MAG: hypothetical protein RBU30_02155, partial [Polyangia bacterium]|nr:hypothetical protein [Polyangia bacterium]